MSSRRFPIDFMTPVLVLFFSPLMAVAASPLELVGTWKLVVYEDRSADAPPEHPYGVNPMGLLIYDVTGHMAIQIMKAPPPKVASGDEYNVTSQEKVALMDGYVAYFGTYTVDWTKHVVTHRAQGDLYSVYIGRAEERPFELNGDRLTLTPRWERGGKSVQGIRVFVRVK
jgi:hypothetical protein